jgi:hypothetical protein
MIENLKSLTRSLASDAGLRLTNITIESGEPVGCGDAWVLDLYKGNKMASVLIYQTELNKLQHGLNVDQMVNRINSGIARLSKSIEEGTRKGEDGRSAGFAAIPPGPDRPRPNQGGLAPSR